MIEIKSFEIAKPNYANSKKLHLNKPLELIYHINQKEETSKNILSHHSVGSFPLYKIFTCVDACIDPRFIKTTL